MSFRLAIRLLLSVLLVSGSAHADYFLHGSQKLDLITHGEMTGEDGARYNVWIVPGYVGPARGAKAGWQQAGEDLAAYGNPGLYEGAAKNSKAIFTFAGEDVMGDFALKGSLDSWTRAMTAASGRIERRVFGWWFAYPWAVIEATGESVLRLGLGVPGGIIIGGVGGTLVPAGELVWPAVKGVYHSTIPGTVLPIAAGGWNTVVAPPMALLGQQPSKERADGFWLTRINPVMADAELLAAQATLRAWSEALMAGPELQAINAQQTQLKMDYERQREEQLKQLRMQYEAGQAALSVQKEQAMTQQAEQKQPQLAEQVDAQKLRALMARYGNEAFTSALSNSGLGEEQANAVLVRLTGSAATGNPAEPAPQRRAEDKTDPLKRSLQLMVE